MGIQKSVKQAGFTLVELLIVVIILAILAAIVVPQFASSTEDAKISSLDSSLANMRSALDLYYQQHNSTYPGENVSSGGTCSAAAGTGAVNTEAAILDQLAFYTNAAGQSCTSRSDGTNTNAYPFGPYLKKRAMPTNPITNLATLKIETAGVLGLQGEATPGGWRYDVISGQFIANDQTTDPNGVRYDAH